MLSLLQVIITNVDGLCTPAPTRVMINCLKTAMAPPKLHPSSFGLLKNPEHDISPHGASPPFSPSLTAHSSINAHFFLLSETHFPLHIPNSPVTLHPHTSLATENSLRRSRENRVFSSHPSKTTEWNFSSRNKNKIQVGK